MQHIATRNYMGQWSVPVGSIIKAEYRACDTCALDVNVLTVRTARGTEVMADDIHDFADDDTTLCAGCRED